MFYKVYNSNLLNKKLALKKITTNSLEEKNNFILTKTKGYIRHTSNKKTILLLLILYTEFCN